MMEDSEHPEDQSSEKQKHQNRQNTSPDLTPSDKFSAKTQHEPTQNSEQILKHIYDILQIVLPPTRKESSKSEDDNKQPPNHFKCKCKKTRCLKMYCECFAVGRMCDGCACQNCNNRLEFEEIRAQAIDQALDRDPDLFRIPSQRQKRQGCICKKTECTKKYCECYSSGVSCGPECKCINCNNL